jgi:hypothetical protein
MKERIKLVLENFLKEVIDDGTRGRVSIINKNNMDAYYSEELYVNRLDLPICGVSNDGIEVMIDDKRGVSKNDFNTVGFIPFRSIKYLTLGDDYITLFCEFIGERECFESIKETKEIRANKVGIKLNSVQGR